MYGGEVGAGGEFGEREWGVGERGGGGGEGGGGMEEEHCDLLGGDVLSLVIWEEPKWGLVGDDFCVSFFCSHFYYEISN